LASRHPAARALAGFKAKTEPIKRQADSEKSAEALHTFLPYVCGGATTARDGERRRIRHGDPPVLHGETVPPTVDGEWL